MKIIKKNNVGKKNIHESIHISNYFRVLKDGRSISVRQYQVDISCCRSVLFFKYKFATDYYLSRQLDTHPITFQGNKNFYLNR